MSKAQRENGKKRTCTHGLHDNDGTSIDSSYSHNQLVLTARKVEGRSIETFTLPFRRQARNNYHRVGLRCESDGVFDGFIGVNLRRTT